MSLSVELREPIKMRAEGGLHGCFHSPFPAANVHGPRTPYTQTAVAAVTSILPALKDFLRVSHLKTQLVTHLRSDGQTFYWENWRGTATSQ